MHHEGVVGAKAPSTLKAVDLNDFPQLLNKDTSLSVDSSRWNAKINIFFFNIICNKNIINQT